MDSHIGDELMGGSGKRPCTKVIEDNGNGFCNSAEGSIRGFHDPVSHLLAGARVVPLS